MIQSELSLSPPFPSIMENNHFALVSSQMPIPALTRGWVLMRVLIALIA
jgi:hypothetical protein